MQTDKKEQLIILLFIVSLNLIHFISLDYYDFSKDEYYKIALSQRPDWGYLGTMPFSVWVVGLLYSVFGDSLVALRLVPAITCLASSYVLTRIVHELGGDLLCKFLAVAAFLNSPAIVGTFHIYSQNPFDVFIWAVAVLFIIRFDRNRRPRDWYWLMAILGIGLLNRLTILWLGFTLLLALIAFNRQWLASRHFWLGGLIPVVIFLPVIYWQSTHNFAHFNYIIDSSEGNISTFQFWLNQLLVHNPLNLVIWGSGLLYMTRKWINPYRLLAVITLGSLIIVTWLGREKPYNFYYAIPVYVILFTVGAMATVTWSRKIRLAVLAVLSISSLITSLAFFTPLSVQSYQQLIAQPQVANVVETFGIQSRVPPQISNQYGWRSLYQAFLETQELLKSRGIEQYVVWPNHYSIVSSIEIFNPEHPQTIITHSESFWLYGFPENEDTFLIITNHENDMLPLFDSVEMINLHLCDVCPKWRRKIYFYLAQHPEDLEGYWKTHLKN